MGKVTDKQLEAYFCEVSKALVCDKKQKKAVLSQLRADVEDYIAENQEATADDIKNCFGTAEGIAASFVENLDAGKLKRSLDIKRLIAFAVIAALIIYALFVVISLIDVHDEAHGYIEEGIMMIKNNITGGELL